MKLGSLQLVVNTHSPFLSLNQIYKMKSQNLACGVDVSKDTLDLYYNDLDDKEHHLKVANDANGHDLLIGN
jgi:hypothetical protein